MLHKGHEEILQRAFEVGDEILIGITSDNMALKSRDECVPLYLRKEALEHFLSDMTKPWRICVIDDAYGPRDKMDRVHVLVVSEETVEGGRNINDDRCRRGIPPLELSVVPLTMADDGEKISSNMIMAGAYGRNGSSKAVDVAVGSLNRVKVEAVRVVMERIYGEARVTAVDVSGGVPEQPFEDQTRTGAVNRAYNALGDHDLAVGIEAGVFERPQGMYDIQFCAVVDRKGRLTIGTGPGFMYPPCIADLVRSGMTVGAAVGQVFGEKEVGRKEGAVGLLSGGILDRKALTEQAIVAAMIPRLNDSYSEHLL